MAYNTTAPTFAATEVVTAAKLNALADGIQAGWASYTPTWTASSVNPSIGNGSIVGAYNRIGKTVFFRVAITCGSTTTFGTGTYLASLPVACGSAYLANHNLSGCSGTAFSGAVAYPIAVNRYTSNTQVYFGAPSGSAVSNTAPFTFVNGSILSFGGTYETA